MKRPFTYSRKNYETVYHDAVIGLPRIEETETVLTRPNRRHYKKREHEVWRALPEKVAGTVLEVACSTGRSAIWLCDFFPTIDTMHAFDFSQTAVDFCLRHKRHVDKTTFWRCEIEAIDRPDDSFDWVHCVDVTEHLPPAVYEKAIREMLRVCKPGGHLILMQGNTKSETEHIHILDEKVLVADFVKAGWRRVADLPHRHYLFQKPRVPAQWKVREVRETCDDRAGERIGVGILCFYGADEVAVNVAAVREHCKQDYVLMLFDNSENDEVGEWARGHAADARYVRSPYNVGCSQSRNRIAATFARMGVRYFIVQDQDVGWTGDVAAAMRAVFARNPKTGVVSWRLAVKQMGNHTWDKTGQLTPPESPGMCCMYDMEELTAGPAGLRGFCPEYLMYRFDTDRCFSAHVKGYGVRIANPNGEPDLVRHDHAHQGVKRYPWWQQEQARSRAIFARRSKEFGFPSLKG